MYLDREWYISAVNFKNVFVVLAVLEVLVVFVVLGISEILLTLKTSDVRVPLDFKTANTIISTKTLYIDNIHTTSSIYYAISLCMFMIVAAN